MKLKEKKGSISIFVLVALLFMSAFLVVSFASNVNKSKTVKEQFNIIRDIYAYGGGEEGAYNKAYTDLREKNKQIMTASVENSSSLELTKTYADNISEFRIYGNSVQDTTNGDPSPDNPVEIQSVGDTVNLFDINNTKYTANAEYDLNNFPAKIENGIMYNAGKYGSSDGACAYIEKPEGSQYLTLSFETENAPEVVTTGIMIRFYYFNEIDETTGIPTDKVRGGFFSYVKGYNKFTTIDCSEYKYVGFIFMGLEKYSISFKNIQLEVGTEATEYTPYGKYRIPVKVNGKNLFKVGVLSDYFNNTNNFSISENTIIGKNVAGSSAYITNKTYYACNTGDSYTLSFDADIGENRAYVALYDKDKNNISSTISISGLTYNQYYGQGALFKARYLHYNKYLE